MAVLLGSRGALEMSVFQRLVAGNGRKPLRLALTPVLIPPQEPGGLVDTPKLAVTVVLAAGMVKVVEAKLALATAAPVQSMKDWPAGGAFAAIGTTVPTA